MSDRAITRLGASLADRYRIERELGAGGMATVYLAHDRKHDRHVAIKVLRDDVAASVGRERFLREIQLAAKLSHPHILPLYDSGEADGALFYVMPNVQGESLRDRLDAQRQLPIHEAVRIASEVAGALEHAHRLGIIHRDIKPENIMLQDGHALVADFGIGKAISDTASDTLTQIGMSVGTPAYMSPEQAVGEEVDGRSDLYSLGCVLYEMIVGEPPFTGPTIQAVIAKRFVQTPLDVAALREGVPRPVSRAVAQVLARVAVDRHATAARFVTALNEREAVQAKAAAPAKSLAILPFENLSADPDNQYFADGIADDILDALVPIAGLHVAGRNSAFSFRGKQVALAEIGETLPVATVLQGSVRKAGNRMRIAVQLVSVTDGYHLWSERFDREMVDVFAVQDEIAAAIAAKLQVTFIPPAQPAGKATTSEVEAFELVAKGRALMAQRGRSLIPARECFERAIALNPQNADAHAALGETLLNFVRYGMLPVAEVRPLIKFALERALELDPQMAAVMGTLASVSLNLEHDPDAAFRWWERALEAQPRLVEVRATYAMQGLICLRDDDARGMAELARAVSDDPRNAFCAVQNSVGLLATGRVAEAVAEAQHAYELDPHSFLTLYVRVFVLSLAGEADAALAAASAAFAVIGRSPWVLLGLPGAYVQRGAQSLGEAVYTELQARSLTEHVSRMALAIAASQLGRVDEAIAYAIDSVVSSDNSGPFFTRRPFFSEAFHAHPRYPELLRAIGL
jgi:TolB-like protein/Tfp pilus assembly protein PilF